MSFLTPTAKHKAILNSYISIKFYIFDVNIPLRSILRKILILNILMKIKLNTIKIKVLGSERGIINEGRIVLRHRRRPY